MLLPSRWPWNSSPSRCAYATREEALQKLKMPSYDPETIDEEFDYIASKLRITSDELRKYRDMPLKSYKDYANQERLFDVGAKVLKFFGVERSIKR